jgi:NAD(P)-dependent dehydrogenase (short-subunit alcohol dehydrogenase family)
VMKLQDRVAIVTGGSRGIGRGICLELAKEGAIVAVNYTSNEQEARSVVEEIERMGGTASAFKADVSQKSSVDEMVLQVKQKFQKIDILVNNAGICYFNDFFDIDEETWRRTLDVNLSGMFFCSQAAAREMKNQGGGSIVNISTWTAYRGGEQQIHYAASKGGVNSLTSSMACALGRYGIRVNAILCGGVVTDINRHLFPEELQVPKARNERLPAGRMGDPEDLGKAVVYLSSDDSRWVTGAQLAVDGGALVARY